MRAWPAPRTPRRWPAVGQAAAPGASMQPPRPQPTWRLCRKLLLGARQVAVPGLDRHGLVAREIADLHRAALDPDEGPVALVLGQPDRPAHGRRGVLARRTELALAAAPQLAEHGLGALLLVDAAHRARGP